MDKLVSELRDVGGILPSGKISTNIKNILNKNPSLKQQIIDKTPFIDNSLRERIYCIINEVTEHPICLHCGKKVKFKVQGGYRKYCSRECSSLSTLRMENHRNSLYEKYGVTNSSQVPGSREKAEKTMLDLYGVKNAFQSPEIKKKIERIMLEKYGVRHNSQIDAVNAQRRQTMLKKYGVEYPYQSEILKNKALLTNKERYGINNYSQIGKECAVKKLNNSEWLYHQHVIEKKSLLEIASDLGVNGTTVKRYMEKHGYKTLHHYQSMAEKEIAKFINELGIKVETRKKDLIGLELDIFLPEYDLAIEFCGLMWHSEQYGKDKYYHRNKLDKCSEKGVRLLTIFEDEWTYRKDIVKSKIKSLINKDDRPIVYARKTRIIRIKNNNKNDFLEEYHLQGKGPGGINYGLLYDEALVAIITLIKQKDGKFIINRYATSCRVVGGFSKLLNFFQKNFDWKIIISFADLRWSDGNLYDKCGFELDKKLEPDYYYIRYRKRYHKFSFRRKYLPSLLSDYDPSLSEKENCDKNGILRIWNCGLLRYKIER